LIGNYANPDMVGHTGSRGMIKAVEATDRGVGELWWLEN
jgi:bisphosphoglycerate-independent phosphoglycerate mutase (AlkP superfamily)